MKLVQPKYLQNPYKRKVLCSAYFTSPYPLLLADRKLENEAEDFEIFTPKSLETKLNKEDTPSLSIRG